MGKNNPNSELSEQKLDEIRENHLKLRAEIERWQQEQGSLKAAELKINNTTSLLTLDKLPEEMIVGLWQRLNRVAGEFQELDELYNLLHKYKNGEPLNGAIAARLQLAYVGVAELFCQKLVPVPNEIDQPYGSCPVCGEKNFMTILAPPVGKRYRRCLVCSFESPVKASGCINCGSEDAKKQTYLQAEEYPGFEVAVCSDCGGYFKQIDLRKVSATDLVWEDIRTMPLNYAAEKWLAGQQGWN